MTSKPSFLNFATLRVLELWASEEIPLTFTDSRLESVPSNFTQDQQRARPEI